MKKYLPIVGFIICAGSGVVAIYLFVWLYGLFYELESEDIGFGAAYPALVGIALTFFFLKKYFPVLIVRGAGAESQTFDWVLRVVFILVGVTILLIFTQ